METLGLISELLNQNLHRKRPSGDSYAPCWRMSSPENMESWNWSRKLPLPLTLFDPGKDSGVLCRLPPAFSSPVPRLVLTVSALSHHLVWLTPWCLSSSWVLPKSFSFPGHPPWASVLPLLPKPQRAINNCKSHCTWSVRSYNKASQRPSSRCVIISSNDTRTLGSLVYHSVYDSAFLRY